MIDPPAPKPGMHGCLKAFLITLAVGAALVILLVGTCAVMIATRRFNP